MDQQTISVIIPYYESDAEKPAVLKRCTQSLNGHDELIVVWNDKMGYAKAINKGLAIAKGDFLIVMNDDVSLQKGSLRDLIDPNAVTSPIVNGHRQDFYGCFFCIPRWVYEKVGGLWEGYRISYFDDDDYIMMLKQAGIPMHSVDNVEVSHPDGGRTLHTFSDRDEFFEENRQTFIKRWGRMP